MSEMEKIVLFGKNHYQYNGFDINKYIYHDAIIQENVIYIEPKASVWDRYLNFFFTNEYGIAFRKKLFLPFRKTAFRALLHKASVLRKKDCNIFVFFYAEPWFFDEKGFLAYLRHRYSDARLVYHITNTVQNIQHGAAYYKKYFDLVSTCNKGDSEKHDLPFFANTCSYIPFRDNEESKSDCFFVGHAKNRLNDLVAIFEILTRKGVQCEFYIIGVNEEHRPYDGSIHYNQVLNYDVILRKIEKTNVILELLQEGMDSQTLRYSEAVNYRKKLLTNNRNVVNELSYSAHNIHVIASPDDVSEINTAFFKTSIEEEYPNRDSVSSRNFLSFIRKHIELPM